MPSKIQTEELENSYSAILVRFSRGQRGLILVCAALVVSVFLVSCSKRETRIAYGDAHQILCLANGSEPEDLDPQIVTGVTEDNIIRGLIEGLVVRTRSICIPFPVLRSGGTFPPMAKFIHSIFVRTQNGRMAIRSKPWISFEPTNAR